MSESNGPQRFEALETSVTEKQEQMSELMKMMRQLTQTRTCKVVFFGLATNTLNVRINNRRSRRVLIFL